MPLEPKTSSAILEAIAFFLPILPESVGSSAHKRARRPQPPLGKTASLLREGPDAQKPEAEGLPAGVAHEGARPVLRALAGVIIASGAGVARWPVARG